MDRKKPQQPQFRFSSSSIKPNKKRTFTELQQPEQFPVLVDSQSEEDCVDDMLDQLLKGSSFFNAVMSPLQDAHKGNASKRFKPNQIEEEIEVSEVALQVQMSKPLISKKHVGFHVDQPQPNQKAKSAFQVFSSEKKPPRLLISQQNPFQNTQQTNPATAAQISDLSNHNLIDNKRSRVNKALKILRELKSKPRFKDKYGNNVKQHFGIYKYFINTQNQEKEKFYISNEGQKVIASHSMSIVNKESEVLAQYKYHYLEQIQKTGQSTKDKQRLEYWGLPAGICDQFYRHTKIKKLFEWQAECLSISQEVVKGQKHLIYFAPTSGGKSVVSEILMLRQILGFKKRALYVLPFVSIVTEKHQYLSKLCENVNVKIIALHSQSENVWSSGVDIAICTIEKANSLLNRVIEEKLHFDISFFIIDEFHLILDEGRGYQLESLIAKLRTIEAIMQKQRAFQIVGMSATLSGLDHLMRWLGGNCAIYECQFRPVPLSEYLQIGQKLFNKDMKCILDFQQFPKLQVAGSNSYIENDYVRSIYLIIQLPLMLGAYLRKRKAVLIFCPTKNLCEQVAKKLSMVMPMQYPDYNKSDLVFTDIDTEIILMIDYLKSISKHLKPNTVQLFDKQDVYDKKLQAQRLALVNELKQCPSGLCLVLKETIKYGIAYHHSGLTTEEREIVERVYYILIILQGYRTGVLLVLVATSTLSTGINLPAKAVIFKGPTIANQQLDAARYKQMSGRAGRTGFDSKGDSIMVCSNQQKDLVVVRIHHSHQLLVFDETFYL